VLVRVLVPVLVQVLPVVSSVRFAASMTGLRERGVQTLPQEPVRRQGQCSDALVR
jgi:hypothetical protein